MNGIADGERVLRAAGDCENTFGGLNQMSQTGCHRRRRQSLSHGSQSGQRQVHGRDGRLADDDRSWQGDRTAEASQEIGRVGYHRLRVERATIAGAGRVQGDNIIANQVHGIE